MPKILCASPRCGKSESTALSTSAAAADYRHELSANLTASLSDLASMGITPTVYPVDAWTNTIRVMAYPERYGFLDISNSVRDNSDANPDEFLFWDEKHPTTAAHYQTAKGAHDALTLPFIPPGMMTSVNRRSIGTPVSMMLSASGAAERSRSRRRRPSSAGSADIGGAR